jgi:tetratricopeptide (TPR) repeat protein
VPRPLRPRHPAEVDLFDLAIGRLDREAVLAAREHVQRPCARCAKRLDDLRRTARSLEDARELSEASDGPLPAGSPEDSARAAAGRRALEDLAHFSDAADARAVTLVDAAGAGPDSLQRALAALEFDEVRPLALLYTAQRAGRLSAKDPNAALELALRLKEAVPSLPAVAASPKAPATAELLLGEALLLESQALLVLGQVKDACERVVKAREAFAAAFDTGFSTAVCDYFEGSSAGFAGQFARAEKLLKRALGVFADFGQENWMGRAEAALGGMFSQRGDHLRAVDFLDRGLRHLSPDLDANAYVASLLNKASGLVCLGRFDEARACYAEGLTLSLKHNFTYLTFGVRMGLAILAFHKADFRRALPVFQRLVDEADASGYTEDSLYTRLWVAECLGRLGQDRELAEAIESLRRKHSLSPFDGAEALEELFTCFDRGELDAGLIQHVREYVEQGLARGAYRPLSQVG